MREIKFRLIKNNKIVGYERHMKCLGGIQIEQSVDDRWGNTQIAPWIIHDKKVQYTGLKDENEKEIYEGDSVKCDSSRKCPHEVIWTDICNQNLGSVPGWYLSGLNNPGYSFTGKEEIVGNIYENPELLKDE